VIDDTKPAGYGDGKRISGFEVSLMKRIAEHGNFSLDYHGRRVVGQTWTEALIGDMNNYDLFAGGGWMDTSDRRRRGVTFSTPISNNGIILAMKRPEQTKVDFWDNAFFFRKPFQGDAYLVVAGFVIFPPILVWWIERERQPGVQGLVESIFMSWLAVLGAGDFTTPRNWFARLCNVFIGFSCLVLVSAYTASLTNFLVTASRPKQTVSGASDFLQQGFTACAPKGWGSVQLMKTKWADYDSQIREVPPAEMSRNVATGACDGVLLQHDYMRILLAGGPPKIGDAPVPHGCELEMVGATEVNGVGAFPAGASGCKWFVMQVINSIVRELDELQEVEEMFRTAVDKATQHSSGLPLCPPVEVSESEDTTIRIGPEHLVGLMIVLMGPMLLITIVALAVERILGEEAAVDTRPMNVDMQTIAKVARSSQMWTMVRNSRKSTLGGTRKSMKEGEEEAPGPADDSPQRPSETAQAPDLKTLATAFVPKRKQLVQDPPTLPFHVLERQSEGDKEDTGPDEQHNN